jgi:uncharacterized caspase-like protein
MKQLLLTLSILFLMGCNFNELNPYKRSNSKVNYQRKALIVGVSDYGGTQSDFGQGIEMDVNKMKELFEKWGFEVTVLFNEESMTLEDQLTAYSHDLSDEDKFIFYYTGHGSHTADVSGDEADGEDESLVLSNGKEDYYFLDDTLNGYMNLIKAKKLVFFDSCHSGSAFRGLSFSKNRLIPKSLSSQSHPKALKTRSFQAEESLMKDGEYIVFSASQDDELSLASNEGSLFTNALYKQLNSNKGLDTNIGLLNQRIKEDILDYCDTVKSDAAHNPRVSVSSVRLKESSLNDFLGFSN